MAEPGIYVNLEFEPVMESNFRNPFATTLKFSLMSKGFKRLYMTRKEAAFTYIHRV